MNSLLTGFIGAIIALILNSAYTRINNAIRLNRVRKLIVSYLTITAKDKLTIYISDLQSIQRKIHLKNTPENDPNGYDDLPMLTSDVIKSFAQVDLFLISNESKIYLGIIELYYTIDFLKKNMPRIIIEEYFQKINNHLDEQQIRDHDQRLKHTAECDSIAEVRKVYNNNINMLIETAARAIGGLKVLSSKISGPNRKWIYKYFWV